VRGGLYGERDEGEPGDGVAEADPVAVEEIRGDEGRGEAAESEEDVDEVESRGAMRFSDVAGERVGAGDNDAAAHAEEKEEHDDAAESGGARDSKERDEDEGEAEDESDFFSEVVEERADAERGDHESEGLSERDGAILARGELKAAREIGEDSAEHGGNHAVDEDGDDCGEDQQAWFS
jgi:hypothetical protein